LACAFNSDHTPLAFLDWSKAQRRVLKGSEFLETRPRALSFRTLPFPENEALFLKVFFHDSERGLPNPLDIIIYLVTL
jgi:hypothetical protein